MSLEKIVLSPADSKPAEAMSVAVPLILSSRYCQVNVHSDNSVTNIGYPILVELQKVVRRRADK